MNKHESRVVRRPAPVHDSIKKIFLFKNVKELNRNGKEQYLVINNEDRHRRCVYFQERPVERHAVAGRVLGGAVPQRRARRGVPLPRRQHRRHHTVAGHAARGRSVDST
ncbi:unnamed protein product [Spodoptera exigua]|nr:unnamed protein product [Spodoptera exigua]